MLKHLGYLVLFFFIISVSIVLVFSLRIVMEPSSLKEDPTLAEMKNLAYRVRSFPDYRLTSKVVTFRENSSYRVEDILSSGGTGQAMFCVEIHEPECPEEYVFPSEDFSYIKTREELQAKTEVSGKLTAYNPTQARARIWVGFKKTKEKELNTGDPFYRP